MKYRFEKDTEKCTLHSVSVSDVKSFIDWKEGRRKEYIGGKLMYDIIGYYKRLDESELFDYWLEHIHSR